MNGRQEDFRDMEEMIAFWVELEIVENTPVFEQVASRGSPDQSLRDCKTSLKKI